MHDAAGSEHPVDFGGPVDRPFDAFPKSALDGSIVDRFAIIARRFPDRLAVQDRSQSITYSRLATYAAGIATALVDAIDGHDGPVAILLEKDARYIAAMLGVLAAGRGYIPLDASHPYERNRLIAARAGVCAVVSGRTISEQLKAIFPLHLPVVDIDELGASPVQQFNPRSSATGLAAVLFTSGSTGSPKGVPLSHGNLLHDTGQYTNAFHITVEDRISLLYSPSVRAAARDIYAALLNGASLHVISPGDFQPADLVKEIRARSITVYDSVPTLFRRLAERLGTNERLNSVRLACLTGERIEWHDVDACRRVFSPGVSIYMGLGSTEATCTRWFVDDRLRQSWPRPPVGRPFPNRTLAIMGENEKAVADGAVGEIWIKSRYIPEGYWREPELTSAVFTRDESDPSARVFRTGDLARRQADGLIEFVGRKDRQIKLRGHRIELGEIEALLRTCPEVRDTAIHVQRNRDGAPIFLVAYVMPQPTCRESLPSDLLALLSQRLPRYMVPSRVVIIDELPRLPGLKVDLAQLAAIDADRVKATDREQVATPVQHELALLWQKVLKLESLPSLEDNFFEIGGDSLASAELIADIEEKFCCELPVELFFKSPTIATLDRLLDEHNIASKSNSTVPPARNGTHGLLHKLQTFSGGWHGERLFPGSLLVGLNRSGGRPPLFWVFQQEDEFLQLAKSLGTDQPLYGMRSCVGIIEVKDYSTEIIEAVCNRYLWEILALSAKNKLIIGGTCQGGIFAFALAQRLKQIDRTPALLILMEWTYSYGRYTGPTLLLYGDRSNTAEIYLSPEQSLPNWREDFPCNTVISIPGGHFELFSDDNIKGLGQVIAHAVETCRPRFATELD